MRLSQVVSLFASSEATRFAINSVENSTDQWALPTFGGEAEPIKTFTGNEPSPFATYTKESVEVGCLPRTFRSKCPTDEFNGVVVFIHGFSGCSDQADKLGARLSKACYDVLAPTLPGHGTPLNVCKQKKCSVKIGQGKGFDLTNLPTHEQGYLDFTKKLASVVKDEKLHLEAKIKKDDIPIHIIGFALGGPVALTAVMQNPGLFGRMMLLNPYFAMGDESIDRKAVKCEADAKAGKGKIVFEECRQQAILDSLTPYGVDMNDGANKYMNWLASSRGTFEKRLLCNLAKMSNAFGSRAKTDDGAGMLNDVMEGVQSWNTVCDQTLNHGRKGFCKFKTKHVLALHSFAVRALVDAQAWGQWMKGVPVTQILSTQRDGRTRNGMTYKVAQHLSGQGSSPVSMCLHRYKKGVDPTNPATYWNDQVVMPHAVMMPKNAKGWWENGMYSKIEAFLGGSDSVGGPQKWDGKRGSCVDLPLGTASYSASKELQSLVVPEAASTSKVNCVWVGPLWKTVEAYDRMPSADEMKSSVPR